MRPFHLLPFAVCTIGAATPALAQDEATEKTPVSEYPIEADALIRTVQTIASDQFEGRAPGTVGEERTVGYLIGKAQEMGLQPGGVDGGWTQTVPLLHTQLGQPTRLMFTHAGQQQALRYPDDIYLSTLQPSDEAAIRNAPLVFVGYGVDAPERDWDDFEGTDLKGKVAVFLVNDPDFKAASGELVAGVFKGRTMTYYGRWTYKFEEAARRGAVGALIVHETDAAGYGWNVIESPGGENYDVMRAPDALTTLELQGWITGDTAQKLFTDAGLDLAAQMRAARRRNFRPVDLKTTLTVAFPVTHETVDSQNVFAKIPGTKRPDETVIYGAHWDAYGKGEKADAQGRIYRAGANDDGLGVAGLFEIARSFKAAPTPPDRTVVFAFWTAEERGLLGSEYYASHPIYPVDTTVANLAIDILQTAGKAKDVILVGKGQDTLEDDMARVAATQGRTVSEESLPERGLFYRADHFSFAKRGVPVLLLMGIAGATDLADGGKAAGQAWVDQYTGNCYHATCDVYGTDWDLAGAVQDISLMRDIGAQLAYSDRWPGWKDGSEFKAIRQRTAAARQ